MRGWSGLAALALLVACARENPLYSESDAGSGSSAATSTTGTSTASNTSAAASAGTTVTPTETTAVGEESGKDEDSGALTSTTAESDGSSTSSSPGERCPYAVDDNVVAHYRFDDPKAPWIDETGNHDGTAHKGMPLSVPGPEGCGDALGVSQELVGRVPDAPAFDLDTGSVDFWVFVPKDGFPPVLEPDDATPLISRDAAGTKSEHLTIFITNVNPVAMEVSAGHLVVRHQSMGVAAAVCSEAPLPSQTWVHVAYNFGPPNMELFIDGVLQEIDGQPIVPGGGIPTCDGVTNNGDDQQFVGGLDTTLPLYIAASAINSNKMNQIPTSYMNVGALDEIRISDVRRDFAAL